MRWVDGVEKVIVMPVVVTGQSQDILKPIPTVLLMDCI